MDLTNKVALVTGGAQGLGKAFSEELLSKGTKICVIDVKDEGQTTVNEMKKKYGEDRAIFVKCDVTKTIELKNAFQLAKKTYGKVDIVVNNAGIANETEWRKMIDINLVAVIQGTELAIEYMSKENGGEGGVIVQIASLAGLTQVYIVPVYSATKHGVIGYTRSLADHPSMIENGLRFCCLCPGFTDTPLISPENMKVRGTPEDLEMTKTAFGVGKVAPVVDAFIDLVTDQSNNGAVMKVIVNEGVSYAFRKENTTEK